MKYLKTFEELKTITRKSNTGSTRWKQSILDEPSDSKPYAAYLLLKDKLRKEELKSLFKKAEKYLSNKQIKKYTRSGELYKIMITLNNLKFLKDKEKELGKLYCEYCNKGPLKIYDIDFNDLSKNKFKKIDGATADHKTPKSKGGEPFDYDNLAVSCFRCNNKKGDKDYKYWIRNK